MKKILCIALAFLFCFSSILTVSAEEVKWLAKPQYDEIYGGDEDGNLILAKIGEKYGYIDKNGKIIIDFVYDYATGFSKGMAYVEKDRVSSYIDKSGKTLFELKAKDYIKNLKYTGENDLLIGSKFSGDYAIVTNNESFEIFIIDRAGKYVPIPNGIWVEERDIYNNIAIVRQEAQAGMGYLNVKTGKTVFSTYRVDEFKDGYGLLDYGDGTIAIVNENLDFINKKINVGNASAMISNGLIYLGEYTEDMEPLNASYIDMNGKTIIPKNYLVLSDYEDGLIAAIIEEDGVTKIGYLDIKGQWVIKPIEASSYSDFFKGIAALSETFNEETYNENFGIIDKTGKYVIQPQFQDFSHDNHNIFAKVDGLWGILNSDGLITTNVPNDTPDAWAADEVTKAINNNLVPAALQNKYKEKITRKDFCDLAISLIESKSGKSIDEFLNSKGVFIAGKAFKDTDEKNILIAYALSIVNGKGNELFDPNGFITRQEAAVMLANTAKALGVDINSKEAVFSDSNSIATWAKAAVNYVSSSNVMKGTSNGFEAKGNYTRQQAYITIFRLFEAVK